ncbi:MAG: indole-3-glycerol phosphate synthase TrpC [Steroidobacteraceae bacterium]
MNADTGFLQQMAAGSRERVATAKRMCSEAALLERALACPHPPTLQASAARFDLIAELKLRSPAVGQLKSCEEDVGTRVSAYARAGAAAVSVLTEPSRFDGSMTHLQVAAQSLAPLHVPAMRKDFLVDPYQVIEARAAGAGGVLVILRMLSRDELEELMDCARTLDLFVLLEAFDAQDIESMHALLEGRGPLGTAHSHHPLVLAGLNCRDLATLQIVPSRLDQLAHLLPASVPRVAESGIVSPADAARVAAAGYSYALVGSALMQDGDPHCLAVAMLQAGRDARLE